MDRGFPNLVQALQGTEIAYIMCGYNHTAGLSVHRKTSDSSRKVRKLYMWGSNSHVSMFANSISHLAGLKIVYRLQGQLGLGVEKLNQKITFPAYLPLTYNPPGVIEPVEYDDLDVSLGALHSLIVGKVRAASNVLAVRFLFVCIHVHCIILAAIELQGSASLDAPLDKPPALDYTHLYATGNNELGELGLNTIQVCAQLNSTACNVENNQSDSSHIFLSKSLGAVGRTKLLRNWWITGQTSKLPGICALGMLP